MIFLKNFQYQFSQVRKKKKNGKKMAEIYENEGHTHDKEIV